MLSKNTISLPAPQCLLRFMLVYVVAVTLAAPTVAGTYDVRYWGGTPGRMEYELELLRQALDAGGAEEFSIIHINQSFGSVRGRKEVALGDRVNVYASGLRRDELVQNGDLILVEQPLLKGLLGYRSAIVTSERLEEFSRVTSLAQLQKYVLGQGAGWYDIDIYRHNGIEVNDNGRYGLLLGMLAHNRFDILVLGVMEVGPALGGSEYQQQLSKVPGLVIYYPFPLNYYVSGKHPELAKRIQKGLAVLVQNGSMERLFNQFYGETIGQMQQQWQHMIVLEHADEAMNSSLYSPQFMPTPGFQ